MRLPWRFARVFAPLVVVAWSAPAAAQSPIQWQQMELAPKGSLTPAIDVDGLGYLHVAWSFADGGVGRVFHASNKSGGWHHVREVEDLSGASIYFPIVAGDRLGYHHIAWRNLATSASVQYLTSRPATSWSGSFRNGHTHELSLETLAGGQPQLFSEADCDPGNCTTRNTYHQRYANPVIPTSWPLDSSVSTAQFSTAVGADDTLHFVVSLKQQTDAVRGIYYSFMRAGQATWSTPVRIESSASGVGWPHIAIDPQGYLHVVFTVSDQEILYTNNRSGGWSIPVDLSNDPSGLDTLPSLAIDPNGGVHVAWIRLTTPAEVRYSHSLQGTWSPASVAVNNLDRHDTQVSHLDQKIAVDAVNNRVYVPYQKSNKIWLAYTGDVPVASTATSTGTTQIAATTFVSPTQILSSANSAAAALPVLEFTVSDLGGDGLPTNLSAIVLHAGPQQTFSYIHPQLARTAHTKLKQLLGGAQIVLSSGTVLTGVLSDDQIVFGNGAQTVLSVPDGGQQTLSVRVWTMCCYDSGVRLDLLLNPRQDLPLASPSSRLAPMQASIRTGPIEVLTDPNPRDAGVLDAAPSDAAPPDAGLLDAAVDDAALADGGEEPVVDSGFVDVGAPDGGFEDAAAGDALGGDVADLADAGAASDAAVLDGEHADASSMAMDEPKAPQPSESSSSACSCETTHRGAGRFDPWGLALGLVFWARSARSKRR